MHLTFNNAAVRRLVALLCAGTLGFFAAGCHNNNQNSGFGVAWSTMTLADDPGPFTSYLVGVDSVVLVGKLNGSITAIGVPETVDFTKLKDISELWATASVPVDTYTSAIITLDYTGAQISIMVNGAPVAVKVVDPTGAAPTTLAVTVDLDPANLLVLQSTLDTSNALRLAFNMDLTASNKIDMTTSPPTVTVKPFMTVGTTASDNKLIRVRGPLINSSVNIDTYTVVVRPFFDQVNSLGILTVFNDTNTVYSLAGATTVGSAGLTQLSQTSAGSTMTAAYTTFEPTTTPAPGVNAGIFHSKYIVAGGTLEDFFTEGLEGDVIARAGNVLTLRGATLFANLSQVIQYEDLDSVVTVGPATQVTADDVPNTTLNFDSIAVGQHIIARGLYSLSATGVTQIDATGSTSTDTGSVRIQSTELFGTLNSEAAGSLALNLQYINNWPVSDYNFAGNGLTAAQDSNPDNYLVNTGALTLPPVGIGDLLWIDGFTSPFGSAPPDFNAQVVNAESTVSATLAVSWTGTGTVAPFSAITSGGLTLDLTNAAFGSGQLRIGAASIDLTTLTASPSIVPAAAVPAADGLPLFMPIFSVGPGTLASVVTSPILSFNGFAAFVTQLNTTFAAPTPATQFVARGFYDRTANTFTASSIDIVL